MLQAHIKSGCTFYNLLIKLQFATCRWLQIHTHTHAQPVGSSPSPIHNPRQEAYQMRMASSLLTNQSTVSSLKDQLKRSSTGGGGGGGGGGSESSDGARASYQPHHQRLDKSFLCVCLNVSCIGTIKITAWLSLFANKKHFTVIHQRFRITVCMSLHFLSAGQWAYKECPMVTCLVHWEGRDLERMMASDITMSTHPYQ